MKKKLKSIISIMLGVMAIVTGTLIAAPALKEVQAYFKEDLKYTLDGEEVLKGKGGLVYEDKVYIPIRDVATTLGAEVDYKDNTVIMKSKPVPTCSPAPTSSPATNVVIPKAVVKEVNTGTKQVTVLPAGKEDKVENYVVLQFNPTTTVTHEKVKKLFSINDLQPGMEVRVIHSPMMTKSIPPQTPAINVTVLGPVPGEPKPSNVPADTAVIPKAIVKDVNTRKNQVTVLPAGKPDTKQNTVILNVTDNTNITDGKTKKAYSIRDIKPNMAVEVVHSAAVTKSIPPQAEAIQITFLEQKTTPTPTPTQKPAENVVIPKAKVVTVDSGNKQVTVLPNGKANKQENFIVLNVGPNTVIKDEKTKKLYSIEDLKTNMDVRVVHSPAMTASIPPQTAAIEITILGQVPTEPTPTAQTGKTLTNVQAVEVGNNYVLVGDTQNPSDPNKQTKVMVTGDTQITGQKDKRIYKLEDIKVGDKLTIVTGGTMTASIPPQTDGKQIIIMK